MSFGNGNRMDLLAGLRSARANNPEQQQHHLQQQQQQQLQMLLQQQQMQFYAQNQTQMHQAPSQAQLLALQQSQLELQLQQMQMANLALQEQILLQHQQQQQATQAAAQTGSASGGYRSLQHQASRENLDETQQARRSALRSLPTARKQRDVSGSSASNLDWQAERMRFASPPPAEKPPLASSPPKNTSDPSGSANGPRQSSGAVDQATGAAQAPGKIIPHHHRKTSSLASAASARSAALSDAGSLYSPNQGPALILSKPKDEFAESEDEEDDSVPGDTPASPSLHASIRALNLVGEARTKSSEDGAGESPQQTEAVKPKKVKRHTVILTSSLPRITSPPPIDSNKAAAAKESQSSSSDSCTSSQSSSPTSDKSDIASFDSAASVSTASTSLPTLSPTATTFVKRDDDRTPPSVDTAQTRNFTMPAKASQTPNLNPAAAAFSPAGISAKPSLNNRYPSSLSLQSSSTTTPVATPPPMRLFSAPPPSTGTSSGFGTPTGSNGITVIRQPRGPAKEADLSAKNFAGMIRRKAVGALRVAASNGGRISPVASPVVATFGQSAFDAHMRHATSPPLASSIVSPPLGSGTFADFGAELTQRALKRRSQQYASSGANPGLGML